MLWDEDKEIPSVYNRVTGAISEVGRNCLRLPALRRRG